MHSSSRKINNEEVAMVQVSNLHVRLGEQPILTGVSFQIEKGQIAAVIGPNGSGKTTLIRAILGLVPIERGDILIDGQPLNHRHTRIGYLPQRFQIDAQFPITVEEYLRLSLNHGTHVSLTEKLEEVGLAHSVLKKRVGSLSGGQLQRVLIAQATLHHPELLILDEPSTGIDIVGEKQFYDLMQGQRNAYGTTVIIVSHDISVISHVVDQIVCVNKRLVCFGPPKTALTKETIGELYGNEHSSVYHHRHG